MKRGKYETPYVAKRRSSKKALAVLLSLVLVIGCVAGGTLAWLTADGGSVTNTFTESDIDIMLSETGITETERANEYKMVPGWTIDKDPKVTVSAESEDCWLFVKITESTTPDLDAYIAYAITDGWQIVAPTDNEGKPVTSIENADEIVIGRKVYQDDTTKEFSVLGAGEYTDPMGTDADKDDCTITWSLNQVCVKPSVTEQMMEAITGTGKAQPTLSFQAYAVQLFKTNSDSNKDNTDDEFTAAEAWARAAGMNSGN